MFNVQTSEGDSNIHSFREEQYMKARDYHLKLEIQIPELDEPIDKEIKNSQPMMSYASRENMSSGKENYGKNVLNASQSATYMKPKRQINTELATEYTFAPSIHPTSKSIERGVDHLYKWKENVEKRKEMKRENVIDEADNEKRVYTNRRSEELIANSRPALRVEDSLIMREGRRKEKLKQLEKSLYERPNIPEISEKASQLKPKGDLLTRLYHQPLQKKLLESRNSSRSLTPSLSSEPRKRSFNPFSGPIGNFGSSANRRPQTTKSVKSPQHFTAQKASRQMQVMNEDQMMGSINQKLTKKVLPFAQNGSLQSDFHANQEKSVQQSQLDSSLTSKRIAPNFLGERSNLPNMLFFDGQKDPLNEKFSAFEKFLAKQDLKAIETTDVPFSVQSQTDNLIKHFENDVSSASRDSSQILRIQKTKAADEFKNLNGHSLHERNQIWLNQKNQRIESKQQQKKAKELEGCTFRPKLSKKPAPQNLDLSLVPNFKSQGLVQISPQFQFPMKRIITPSQRPHPEEQRNILKQRASPPKIQNETSSSIQVQMAPRSVNVKIHIDEHRNHFNIYNINQPGTPKKTIYNDLAKQQKLINYILDSENLKTSSQKASA